MDEERGSKIRPNLSPARNPVIRVCGTVIVDGERELGEVWVAGGRIHLERERALAAAADDGGATGAPRGLPGDETRLTGWALPGLVDAHCHVGIVGTAPASREQALDQARRDRASGALALRDAGSLINTSFLGEDPAMPRIVRAGRHIARVKRYLLGLARDEEPDTLVAAVREEAARSDGWVKIVGDWIDRSGGAASELLPLWPAATLRAAIDAAHEAGARVTMHTFGEQAAAEGVEAGIDCLEHGTGLSPAMIERAAARGVLVTPTVLQIDTFPAIAEQAGDKYPRYGRQMRGLHARSREQWRAFVEAGVPLLMGTDSGTIDRHGMLPDELLAAAAAGIPPRTVLAAASWDARRRLGLPGIAAGRRADLVVYDADPRLDLAVLRHPSAVICGGTLVAPTRSR